MFLLMSDLNELHRINEPEKISTSKKAEPPQSTPITSSARTNGSLKLFPSQNELILESLLWNLNKVPKFELDKQSPNELHFGMILFKMISQQFVL